jgi:hypothetical protein
MSVRIGSIVDERSLAIARSGRYSTAIEETVSAQRLQRFFVREDGSYRVSSELCDICLYAPGHSKFMPVKGRSEGLMSAPYGPYPRQGGTFSRCGRNISVL